MKQQTATGVPLGRVRAVIATVKLDCECRERLNQALERFEALEQRRTLRELIHDARKQADRIAATLDFLRELEGVRIEEEDGSVFEELALLFDEIVAAGIEGAADMRRFGALHQDRRAVGV